VDEGGGVSRWVEWGVWVGGLNWECGWLSQLGFTYFSHLPTHKHTYRRTAYAHADIFNTYCTFTRQKHINLQRRELRMPNNHRLTPKITVSRA
jgi:hypothetical protein